MSGKFEHIFRSCCQKYPKIHVCSFGSSNKFRRTQPLFFVNLANTSSMSKALVLFEMPMVKTSTIYADPIPLFATLRLSPHLVVDAFMEVSFLMSILIILFTEVNSTTPARLDVNLDMFRSGKPPKLFSL